MPPTVPVQQRDAPRPDRSWHRHGRLTLRYGWPPEHELNDGGTGYLINVPSMRREHSLSNHSTFLRKLGVVVGPSLEPKWVALLLCRDPYRRTYWRARPRPDEFCKGPSLSSRAQPEACRIGAYRTEPACKRGRSVIDLALIVDGFIGRLFGQSEFS
jgi:hypothetical protein